MIGKKLLKQLWTIAIGIIRSFAKLVQFSMAQYIESIQPRFIHELQYNARMWMEISRLMSHPGFKVLKVSNCSSVLTLISDMKSNTARNNDASQTNHALIKGAPFLLVIVFENYAAKK